MMKSTMSASFTLTVVGFNSIATPARRTTTSRRVLLATCCLHSCQQSGSNSGSNPPCIDQELPCCCCWAFRPSFAVFVGCKFIEAPALQTTTSRRAILAASCLRSFEQPESNSGSNPTSIDREPPCCCPSSRPPSSSPWAVSLSKHQRVERQPPGVRSSLPAVCIDVSSLSQTLESIRSELTEILRPSYAYRRGIVSQPGAAEEEHLSE